MNCNTEIKNIFVSSENRDVTLYPYGNSYVLHLTTPVKDIFKAELVYASVPNSLYNLENGSNVLTIEHNGISNTFSLTEGFYSGSTLASEITQTISNITSISVQYIPQFGKMLFTSPTTISNFEIQTNNSNLAKMLGIDVNTPYSNVVSPSAPTSSTIELYWDHTRYKNKLFFQSEKVCDLSINEGIFLDIAELRTIYNEDAKSISGNTTSGQTMARSFGIIPMDVNSGLVKNFRNSFQIQVRFR